MAMYTSNEALQYVTYPTQALAKSCKMIPVLLGSVLFLRKSYSLVKYACVILMTVGITIFQMSGKKRLATEGFGGEGLGLVLLAISLGLDGLAGPLQENLKKRKLTNNQQIIVNNVWATALMAVAAAVLGQMSYGVSSGEERKMWYGVRRGEERKKSYGVRGGQSSERPPGWAAPSLTSMRGRTCSAQFSYLEKHPALINTLVLFGLSSAFGQVRGVAALLHPQLMSISPVYLLHLPLPPIDQPFRSSSSTPSAPLTVSRCRPSRRRASSSRWVRPRPYPLSHCSPAEHPPSSPPSQIVMSVVVHGHVLLAQQWAAVGVVFTGLALEVVDSQLEKRRQQQVRQAPGAAEASIA